MHMPKFKKEISQKQNIKLISFKEKNGANHSKHSNSTIMSTVVQFLNGDIICFDNTMTVDQIRSHIANERGIVDRDLIHLTRIDDKDDKYLAVILPRHAVSITNEQCEQFVKFLSRDEDELYGNEEECFLPLHIIVNEDMLKFLLSNIHKLNDTHSCKLLRNPSQIVVDWINERQASNNLRPLDRLTILANPNDILVDRVLSSICELLDGKSKYYQTDLVFRLSENTNPKMVHFVVEWLRKRKQLIVKEFDTEFVWLHIWKILSRSPVQEAVDFVWESRDDIHIPDEFWMNNRKTSCYMLENLRASNDTYETYDYVDFMSYAVGSQNEDILREFVIPRMDKDWSTRIENDKKNYDDRHVSIFYTEFLTNPHNIVVDWILHPDRAHDIITTETAVDLNPNSRIVDYILDNRLNSFVIFENPLPRVQTYAVEWAETYASFDQTFEDMIDRCASWKVALIAKRRFPEARYNLMKWLMKLALDPNVDISFDA